MFINVISHLEDIITTVKSIKNNKNPCFQNLNKTTFLFLTSLLEVNCFTMVC